MISQLNGGDLQLGLFSPALDPRSFFVVAASTCRHTVRIARR